MQYSIARLIAAPVIVFLSACSWLHDPVPKQAISHESPFGIGWDFSEQELTQRTSERRTECETQSKPLNAYFSVDEVEILVSDCMFHNPIYFDVESARIPEFFRSGEVYATMRDRTGPSRIEYAYLHQFYPSSTPEDNERREQHAAQIRQSLIKLYGAPQANGAFDQNSLTGFIPQSGNDHPCDVWVSADVAIMLCSERIAMIDGIETSLSFVRLDREPGWDASRQYVTGWPESQASSANDQDMFEYRASHLQTLLNWLTPEQFDECQEDYVEPLEAVWTLSSPAAAELAERFDEYSGDQLALRAIELAEDFDDETDLRMLDKSLMYLFRRASEEGSAIATNEIGASLLYCYQGVEQDIPRAMEWLSAAADAGDAYAQSSLALLHMMGEVPSDAPKAAALELLRECASLDEETCGPKKRAIEAVLDTP
ncbi:MAG: hypothetical protein QNI84_00545 [Henriciella sp.]|nr:hypothetical protein [Henriciella sp.]